jgi:16S rRNA A1518/A1519 N6-dimethyltransferase RsmA/KsgA/DIM1 with predicted DNA glycosylase/AP lyase activity
MRSSGAVVRRSVTRVPASLHTAIDRVGSVVGVRLGRGIPAMEFRPVPRVDAAVLIVTRRDPPLLPPAMAASWATFVRARWPFDA